MPRYLCVYLFQLKPFWWHNSPFAFSSSLCFIISFDLRESNFPELDIDNQIAFEKSLKSIGTYPVFPNYVSCHDNPTQHVKTILQIYHKKGNSTKFQIDVAIYF